ncbi:NAD(P)H-dependent glycerol-3-phosphate dehydrogenase [Bacteroidota bacterium]
MIKKSYRIGIIGAGGWGTSIAKVLSENKHKVTLWTHEQHVVDELNTKHTNSIYLPEIELDKSIKATSNPSALKRNDFFVLAVPTQFIRPVFETNNFHIKNKLLVNLSKGIEKGTLMRVSEILNDISGINSNQYVILTGPSHAEEVSRKTPTTVVAASDEIENAKIIQNVFSNPYFRVYTSDDVVGCEIGGALKNVIAIAAGIIDGLGIGDNTKAALITRGLAGMNRLGTALGAKPITFSGLSGLGDLIVTCNSRHSRNRYVGEQIGKGKKLDDILKDMQMVAEGVHTTASAYHLGERHKVELPITAEVYNILFENVNPLQAVKNLMTRRTRREWWW